MQKFIKVPKVEAIGRTNLFLTYFYKNQEYKLLVNVDNSPDDILYVQNDKGDDITEEFLKILGPGKDFHNQTYYPSFFDSKCIHVAYLDKHVVFWEHDVLQIK